MSTQGGMVVEVYGKGLPAEAADVLREVAAKAGVRSVQVTSVARTPAEQARVMWENCAAPLPPALKVLYKDSVARQRSLYKAPGQAVVDVYAAHRTLAKDACVALMLAKIMEVGPRKVSLHCAGPDAAVWVFDVAPSSVPVGQRVGFVAAATSHPKVKRFLQPPADPAYHFEVEKPAPGQGDS